MTPHRRIPCLGLFAFFLALIVPLLAQDKKTFNLPAGPASDTLKAYATQSGLDVVFVSSATEGITTPEVRGELTPQEAIDRLLSGTPLVATTNGRSGGIKIRREASVELAEKNGASRPVDDRAADGEKGPITMDTFEVFAGRTLNMDIRRTRDDAQPYVVFHANQIEESGATNLEDFLRQRLTMVTSYQTNAQGGSDPSLGSPSSNVFYGPSIMNGAGSTVGMRGLSPRETLILVDGRRRATGVGMDLANAQTDINGIPMAAVERIEILPTTAAGIYGGNATAGVINIILKRNYSSTEINAQYENTFDTDASIKRLTLVSGFSVGKATHVLFSAGYSEGTSLAMRDRDFYQRNLQQQLSFSPGRVHTHTSLRLGGTTNIASNTTIAGVRQNLTLKGGGSLGSTITHVPYGYAGGDLGVGLIAGAGLYNLDPANYESHAGQNYSFVPRTKNASLNLRRQISGRVDVFVDLNLSETRGRAVQAANARLPILASAAANPFNQNIIVQTPLFGTESIYSIRATDVSGLVGLLMDLGRDWKGTVDYTLERVRYSGQQPSVEIDSLAARAAVSTGLLNVFRDTNLFPVDFSPYIVPASTSMIRPIITELRGASVRVGGPLHLGLPRPVTVSSSAEWRDERIGETITVFQSFGNYTAPRSQLVKSLYLEANTVIFQDTVIGSLDGQVAARYDDYRTNATETVSFPVTGAIPRAVNRFSAVHPTIALKLSPLKRLALRGSFSTGFTPPRVDQFVRSESISDFTFFPVADPKRGGEPLGTVTLVNGGRADLKAEQSEAVAAGVVLTSKEPGRWRLSADWSQIEKSDNISSLVITRDLVLEDLVPGLVTRAPAGPGDPFGVGPVTRFDQSFRNIYRARSEALDLAFDAELKTERGKFVLAAAATRLLKLTQQVALNTPELNNLGVLGNSKWRVNGTLAWNHRAVTLGWTASYYESRYFTRDHAVDVRLGTAGVDDLVLHDVFLRLKPRSNRKVFSGTDITVGVKNVFNERGSVVNSIGPDALIDPRLSRYHLSVKKAF